MNESERYRFGDFRLIPARRELWEAGRLRSVQPKVFDTLVYLLAHRERVVGRDELVSAVWGRADVTDNVLTQIVGRARQAVGDTGEEQHSIRTVPRFGYQWVQAVEAAAAGGDRSAAAAPTRPPSPSPSPSPSPTSAAPVSPPTRRRFAAFAARGGVGLASLAGLGAIVLFAAGGYRNGASDAASALRAALTLEQLGQARAVIATLSDRERARPEIRQQAALLALKEGRAGEALEAFKTLAADLGSDGDPTLLGEAWYGAGLAAVRRDDLESALGYYTQAVARLSGAGPAARPALGRAWTGLGRVRAACRSFDDAERAYAQARSALEGAGDDAAIAQLESHLGVLLIGRYRHAEALPRFARAADIAARANDVDAETRARMNLVNAHLSLLQPAEALASEPRLRALRERVGDPWLARHVDLVRVKTLTANGRLAEAEGVLRAHAGWPKPDDPSLSGPWNVVAADLAFARGAWDLARHRAEAALDSPWYSPENGMAAYARYRLLAVRDALGDQPGVAAAADAAGAQSRERPGEPTIRLYALLARGEAAAAAGRLVDARADFAAAFAQAEANGVPFDLVQVASPYVRLLLRQGDTVQARALAARLEAWAEHDYDASLMQLAVHHALGGDAWRRMLSRTRRLAGERAIPAALAFPPAASALPDPTLAIARASP